MSTARTPTPEKLLDMALARSSTGRNNAGFWLAQQLHANGYAEPDAEAVMTRFVALVRANGSHAYTESEARATLKAEYRRQAKDPWTSGNGGGPGNWQERKARKARQSFPTAPPVRRGSEPNPDSVERFRRELKHVRAVAGTPAAAYLASRGIPEGLARFARCGYSSTFDSIGQAVVFPIVNECGKPIAVHARAITTQDKRTFGPKSDGAFLTPGALDADPVAITEAPIDALTLALTGLAAIALCGTSRLPSWLIRRLSSPAGVTGAGHSRTVYLAFDNDEAGETAAARIGAAMPLVRTVRLRPKGKDWNEDLTTGGLDSLREWLQACYRPPESTEATESKLASAFCDPVGEGEPGPDPVENGRARIEALAKRIRTALARRPLPIGIKPGESITDRDLYAEAEARFALSHSRCLAAPALERLTFLGIQLDDCYTDIDVEASKGDKLCQ